MPTEVRIYTLKPGKVEEFLEIFTQDIMPTSAAYGIRIHVAWRSDLANEFLWVRSYDDEDTLERYSRSSEHAKYISETLACIDRIDVRHVQSVVGGDLPTVNIENSPMNATDDNR